jgi:hypothetical protein
MPLAPPAHEAVHLVGWVEATGLDQALGHAQGHGGVVGPLAGLESERSPADHVCNGFKGSWWIELQRRAQGVAYCKTQQAPAKPVDIKVRFHSKILCVAYWKTTETSLDRLYFLPTPRKIGDEYFIPDYNQALKYSAKNKGEKIIA